MLVSNIRADDEVSLDDVVISKDDVMCKDDSDCNTPYEYCNEICTHKSVFPVLKFEFLGVALLGILVALASSGGIGGGEVIVPTIKIFFVFSQHDAVPLAQACIFMAALTRFILNYTDKHPYRDAVAIDYNVAMVLLPCIVIGSSIGLYFHHILPELVESILLVILLLLTAVKSWIKATKTWKDETEAISQGIDLTSRSGKTLNNKRRNSVRTPSAKEGLLTS